MQENVLESAKYPEIVYDCSRVSVQSGQWPATDHVAGKSDLTWCDPRSGRFRCALLSQVIRRVPMGVFSLRQSHDYSLKLGSAIGGGLKVRDEIRFSSISWPASGNERQGGDEMVLATPGKIVELFPGHHMGYCRGGGRAAQS